MGPLDGTDMKCTQAHGIPVILGMCQRRNMKSLKNKNGLRQVKFRKYTIKKPPPFPSDLPHLQNTETHNVCLH